VHPTHLLPVRGRRAPSRCQGPREGIHSEARWRAFYAERKCEFRVLFSARAAQNEFFYSTLFWTPFSGERPPYMLRAARPAPMMPHDGAFLQLGIGRATSRRRQRWGGGSRQEKALLGENNKCWFIICGAI